MILILQIWQLPLLSLGFKDPVSEASKYRMVHKDFQWLLRNKSEIRIAWSIQVVPDSKKGRQQGKSILQKLSRLECTIQSICGENYEHY